MPMSMPLRSVALAAIAFGLTAPQVALAAQAPCLTVSEASAVAAYAMPSVISGTAQRCAPVLGKDAWLSRNGTALSQRYADRKPVVWPEAKAALLRMVADGADPASDVIKSLPDASMQQLADSLVVSSVAEKMPASRCGAVDRFLSLISPLPPENTAELVALTLGVLSHDEQPRLGKFAICKA